MPFGLRTAPYLFCKLMETLVKNIKAKFGIILYFYMDDILVLAPSKERCSEHINLVLGELQKAGLTVNFKKSVLNPCSVITFLGVDINLEAKTLVPSLDNISSCIQKVQHFRHNNPKKLKHFQSLIGSLNFAASYIQCGRLHLSPLHKFLPYFNSTPRKVPEELKSLLEFWPNASSYKQIDIPNFSTAVSLMYTDASQSGWGAKFINPSQIASHFQGSWSEEEASLHINIKELKAVILSIESVASSLHNQTLKVFCDNKVAVGWINRETAIRSDEARKQLFHLYYIKKSLGLQVIAFYIKGKQNLTADSLSRSSAVFSELAITKETFKHLCALASISPEVDLFADADNNQCSSYFSASPDSAACGQDALAHSWNKFNQVYAFPPSHLINRAIHKFLNSTCSKMLIIVPGHHGSWHNNVKRLDGKVVPYKFSKNDFTYRSTSNIVPAVSDCCSLAVYRL